MTQSVSSPTHPAFETFSSTFRGTLIRRGEAGYDGARAVWNAAADDLRPALIARPQDAAGVAQAVRHAVAQGLPLAVRGGGHSPAGFGTVQDGLVIDLRGMKGLQIDPASRHVRLEPGLTWGEVAGALQVHGLAITAGDVAAVGVGGLTQGGGIGWFVRQYGLAVDRLRAAELVTARGDLLRVSETEHPEVFWALRGAGANLGVITALEFESHPAGLIYGGLLAFAADEPAEAARLMGDFARLALQAPDALTMQGVFMAAPPAPFVPPHLVGTTIFAVFSCYSGELGGAPAAFAPLRALGHAAIDLTGPMPYPALFEMTAEAAMGGFRHAIRSGFLPELTPGALLALGHEIQVMQPGMIVQLRPLGGQLARVPDSATAFSHRRAPFLLMVSQAVPDASLDDLAWATTERLWAPFAAQSSGLYGNFVGERDREPARAAFTARTLERVARIKAGLDPDNVFSRTVNVRPAVPELVGR
ncbi:FAD-binding oxidoreductase [Deinococcus koreensis]|uniref:FAD-linked oxidase n=1 Tax=Deinococcus koreensis TaxID=2054903 RepID=A0A2K3USE6_9DEIO|nr:FAD-binding oxidoreductase [Deinococcus koreensis]PNY79465.1 FAD-linked oxidase [Deinococcus koreensis]